MLQAPAPASGKHLLDITPSASTTRVVAATLLVLIAILLIASVRQESQTWDEAIHIFAGFEYWKHGDFGRNPEHPPLVKLLAVIPILPMGLKEPPVVPFPYFKAQDVINGSQLLYSGDADAILFRTRMVVALFSLGLAILVFFAAQEMFNPLTALLALGLFAFEPSLLANGALVTTDMPLAFFFFASVYAFYRYIRKPSSLRFALCVVTAALTIVTKQSGILILPTFFLIAIAELFLTRTHTAAEDQPAPRSTSSRAKQLALLLAAVLVVSYGVLWAFYGFRYAARPGQLQMVPSLADFSAGLHSRLQHAAITFSARHHLLPEAYLYGWVDILLIPGYRSTFLFGRVFASGQWFFFPAVFLIKSTLTLLIFLALVPFARIHGKRRELVYLALPAVFYLAVAIFSMLNMGVRHILPVFPFCIVLAGAAAASFLTRSLAARIAVGALLLLTVVSSLHAFPDFLVYANEAAGGPSHAYREVTDSNADWGQGLKWTKSYLEKHPAPDCYLSYPQPFVNPAYYGIPCRPLLSGISHLLGLPAAPIPPTVTGTFFISGTEAAGLLWGPDTLNPYRVFYDRKPDDMIGNIILVYHGTFQLPLLAAQTNAAAAVGLLRQHRFAEAAALAQAAAQQAPDSAEINLVLGQALFASGHAAEGQQAMATALRLAQTDHPEYQKYIVSMIQHPRQGP
jgi:4-amino-4-deoxy-L-arabinose transferase-like glycosyltransferase